MTAPGFGCIGQPMGSGSRLGELGRRQAMSLAVFGATGLPLIVAIVDIGTDRGAIAADVGASLIGAGMISVLAFPLVAMAIAGKRIADEPAPEAVDAVTEY